MVIEDNGIGFESSQTHRGIGLSNIYERISFYQGSVNIQTSPGKGCSVIVTLPLQQAEILQTNLSRLSREGSINTTPCWHRPQGVIFLPVLQESNYSRSYRIKKHPAGIDHGVIHSTWTVLKLIMLNLVCRFSKASEYLCFSGSDFFPNCFGIGLLVQKNAKTGETAIVKDSILLSYCGHNLLREILDGKRPLGKASLR